MGYSSTSLSRYLSSRVDELDSIYGYGHHRGLRCRSRSSGDGHRVAAERCSWGSTRTAGTAAGAAQHRTEADEK